MPVKLNPNSPTLFLDWIQARKQNSMDNIILITGERRLGKSYASISLAQKLDPDFDVEKNLFFEPLGFLKRFSEIKNDVIILDEASLSLDRQRWYDAESRIINSLLLRSGYLQNTVMLVFPRIAEINSRTVGYCTFKMTMKGNDKFKKQSWANVYRYRELEQGDRHKIFEQYVQTCVFNMITGRNKDIYDKMKDDWNKKTSKDNLENMEESFDKELIAKPLPKQHYIDAFYSGKVDEQYFRKRMGSLRVGTRDIDTLVAMKDKDVPKETEKHSVATARNGIFILPYEKSESDSHKLDSRTL